MKEMRLKTQSNQVYSKQSIWDSILLGERKVRKKIRSFITGSKGLLTKPRMENHTGNYVQEYKVFIQELGL
ncbi:hypothetical protein C9J48_07665 [Photobacterium profundum]|nr:hypothetical protein C9J48_07665 [Photobacterium profundum]